MAHPDVPAEQAHVDHAYARLQQMRDRAEGMLRDAFGERGGTFQAITERDIRVRTSLGRLDQLQIGAEALVFGRIDKLIADEVAGPGVAGSGVPASGAPASGAPGSDVAASELGASEPFHIGRLAISDVDQEPLVVDWRAPIAEPFYRATGAHPMELRRRRHFLTEGHRIIDLEDELFGAGGGTEGEEGADLGLSGSTVLLSALARSRTGRMRDIVATVQREQDEVIRGPLGGILVVQGGPGTGKTAVALHRAAYLLYTHRFPLERQGVLVVGPNPTFLRYIEHVLPSLGESGVELSTVSGLFGPLPRRGADEPDVVRLKGDPRMARFLARALGDRQRPLRRPVRIPYGRAFLHLDPSTSEQIVAAAKRRPGSHNARRRSVENLLWRHLSDEIQRRAPDVGTDPADLRVEISGDDGQAEIVELPAISTEPPSPAELGRALRRLPEVAEALDRMWPLLTPEAFLHDLLGARPLLDLAGRGLFDNGERAALYRARQAVLADVAWSEDDIPLLDEARWLLGPLRRRPSGEEDIRTYGHVVVDEAQDLSPMQLRMLARRSLSGSMTVVGDIAQATGSWAPTSWNRIIEHLPARRGWRLVELTVNYRTPAEIMGLADRILRDAAPGMRAPEAVRTVREAPEIVSVDGEGPFRSSALPAEVAERVAAELQIVTGPDLSGTVGVIVPASLLRPVAEGLELEGIPFGTASAGALDSPVSVLGVTDAKGLEFDSVVVVEPSRLVSESPQGPRALYVAVTRATRRLVVVHAEALPSSLATEASA